MNALLKLLLAIEASFDRNIAKAKILEEHIERLSKKMAKFKITTQEAKDLVAGLDAVTSKIAAKLQSLIDQINAGGLSAMDEDDLKAELQRVTDALNALGSDPVDPIPDPDPVP